MVSLLMVSPASADMLAPADREALLQKLESMREDANAKVDARLKAAAAAFSAGASSNDAALELYLKCVEKLNFEDQGKKNADFREWKKKEADKLNSPGFGLALRLQLNWLMLTLRAASPKTDRQQLLAPAQEIVDAVVRQAKALKDHRQILDQGVTSSIFARTYEIKDVNAEKWPMAPGSIEQIYETLLLPPLRKPDQLNALRSMWSRRIQQELSVREAWSGDEGKPKNGESQQKSPYETFVVERLPDLQWQMELDLFENGDQQSAAMRMLQHLERHVAHKSARRWTADLERILSRN